MGSAFSQQQTVLPRAPTGRLTLASGTPVMATEQAAKTNIYYTPYVGATISLYDGTGWRERAFAELTLALAASANWASGSNYDLYLADDNGTLRLGTGAAWTNDTTRSESLAMVNGLYTNNASMTMRYGASSTMTVAANRGLYVGTVRMSANGTTTWELGGAAAGGDAGKLFVWNCYNRALATARASETTASWTYSSTTVRQAQGGANNYIAWVAGLAEGAYHAQSCLRKAMATTVFAFFGIGVGSTTSLSNRSLVYAAGSTSVDGQYPCVLDLPFTLGYQYVASVEQGDGTNNHTTYGGSLDAFIEFSGMF